MITRLMAYKDTKLNVFTAPISMPDQKDEDIVESIRRMCANPKLPEAYFEYDLYSIGTFNDKTGVIEVKSPEFLVSLGDFRYLKEVKKDEQSA